MGETHYLRNVCINLYFSIYACAAFQREPGLPAVKAPGPCTVRPRSATRIQHMTITLESTTKPRVGPRKLVSRVRLIAVESGLAGPVLAGPVFGMAHAQKSNNVRKSKNNDHVLLNAYWPPAVQLLKLNCSNAKLPVALIHVLTTST